MQSLEEYREKARLNAQRWRDNNRERHREYTRKYRREHAAERYAKNRAYALAHLEAVRKWHKCSRQRNPEAYHEMALRWRAKNPDARASFAAERRARLLAADGTFTRFEWAALKAQYGHICLCCKKRKPLTRDHVIPIWYGGRHSVENIQPLCLSCNSAKGIQVIDYRPEGWYLCRP